MNKSKGFTLIELLIVIAILGILASITFYFVRDAKIRGADTGIKQNMQTLSTQAAIFYAVNNSFRNPTSATPYNDYCSNVQQSNSSVMLFKDKIIHNAIARSIVLSGKTNVIISGPSSGPSNPTPNTYYQYSKCYNSASAWAVAVLLRSGNSTSGPQNPYKAWCVDSTGQSKIVSFANLPMGVNTNIISSAGKCQ